MIRTLNSSLPGRGRLQRRFMLIVIAGTVVFSLAAIGMAYVLAEKRALATSRHAIENLTTAVEKSLAVGAFANDKVLLDEIVRGLGGHDLVQSAEVRRPDGKLLVVHGQPVEGAVAAGALVERALLSPFDATEQVGTLRLHVDMHRVARLAVDETLLLGGLMVGQGTLVALLLYAVVAWLVSGPIVRMAGALPEMAPGSARRLEKPAYHHHDEIGLLVDAANALLDAHGSALQRERTLRAEVQAMEAQYRQIFDSSSAGIFVLDTHGRLINSNPTVSRVLGMSREQLVGLQHDSFVKRSFARPEKVQRMVDEAIRSGRTVSGDLQLLLPDSDDQGRWVHCLISVQAEQDPAERTVEGVIYDVTERKFSERRVRHRAEHDALTGLKNRAATQAAINLLITAAHATTAHAPGVPMALLCVDLDGFKRINDEFGHRAGDQVLAACARRMVACVRSDADVVGRVGGDEFIVALAGVGPADPALHRGAEALLHALCRPIELDDGQRVAVGASIGIACAPLHAAAYTALVDAADSAMYEVKRSGKNAFAMAASRAMDVAVTPATPAQARPPSRVDSEHAAAFALTDF